MYSSKNGRTIAKIETLAGGALRVQQTSLTVQQPHRVQKEGTGYRTMFAWLSTTAKPSTRSRQPRGQTYTHFQCILSYYEPPDISSRPVAQGQ
jgi:hypothetical protein